MKTVWANRSGGLLRRKALLVFDSFRGHLTERVKARLAKARTHLAVILGGLKSMLQPLDVSIDRSFKAEFRGLYSEWMAAGHHEKTLTGRRKRASLQLVCSWILNVWHVVPTDIIVKSFKVTRISNAMDGTEDNWIHERADDPSSGDEPSPSSDTDEDI